MTINNFNEPVTSAAWEPNGQTFVTGSMDKQSQLCVWDLDGGRKLYTWSSNYRVNDIAISPDGKRLITISSDRQIFVYNLATREEEYCLRLKSEMTCINISGDSKYMLINMADNELQLFEIESAELVRRFIGQKQGEFVIRSAFGGADENLIISGSEGSPIPQPCPAYANSEQPRWPCLHLAQGEWYSNRETCDAWRKLCQRCSMESSKSQHVRFWRR